MAQMDTRLNIDVIEELDSAVTVCNDPDKWRARPDVSTRWARTDLQLVLNYQPS